MIFSTTIILLFSEYRLNVEYTLTNHKYINNQIAIMFKLTLVKNISKGNTKQIHCL